MARRKNQSNNRLMETTTLTKSPRCSSFKMAKRRLIQTIQVTNRVKEMRYKNKYMKELIQEMKTKIIKQVSHPNHFSRAFSIMKVVKKRKNIDHNS